MSWKLAELKWRQDLGLYESRWDTETGPLPLERKDAIRAFHKRRMVLAAHRTAATVQNVPIEAPQQPPSDLGTLGLPCNHTLPYPRPPPALSTSKSDNRPLIQPLSNQKQIPASSIATSVCERNNSTQPKGERSHSCSHLKADIVQPNTIGSPSLPAHQSWERHLDIIEPEAPQTLQSCEELTRLLDHIDSPGNDPSGVRSETFSFVQDRDVDENQSISFAHQAVVVPFDFLTNRRVDIDNEALRILDAEDYPNPRDLASPSDISSAILRSTLAKHESSSNLLPRDSMPDVIHIPSPDEQERDEDYAQEPRPANSSRRSPGSGPMRRTTPIYEEYGQAYSSITGGVTNPSLKSATPGTDSLNNVYSHAMASNAAASPHEQDPSTNAASYTRAATPVAATVVGGLKYSITTFPFQRSGSPDNDEYMSAAGTLDNNPAGLRLDSNDVPLREYPVLRNVQRGSATFQSSPAPQPSTAACDMVEGLVELPQCVTYPPEESHPRAHEISPRCCDSYPPSRIESSDDENEVESTLGAIVAQYRSGAIPVTPVSAELQAPHPPSIQEQAAAQGVVARMDLSEQVGGPLTSSPVGITRDWPLPVAPRSASITAVPQNTFGLSSSPPTYGSTQSLLNLGGANVMSAYEPMDPAIVGRCGSEQVPGPPLRNAIDRGALQAGRQYSFTPVPSDLGRRAPFHIPGVDTAVAEDPLPFADSRPNSAPFSGPARAPAFHKQRSLSTGHGVVVGDSSLLQVRDALRNRQSLATNISCNEVEDSAWETTQGTNTQRNSAVPESEYLSFPSGSGAEPVSLWGPLSARGRQVEELEREFIDLCQVNGGQQGEAAQAGGTQGSEETPSPQRSVQATASGARMSPILRPTTLITQDATNHFRYSSSQFPDRQLLPSSSSLRIRRNRTTPSETLVEMSCNSAPGSGSRNGNSEASIARNSNTTSPRQEIRAERVVGWRESTREHTLRSVHSDIARYDPPERRMRHFPDARLTIDRRILDAERDPAFVRRQRFLTINLIAAAVILFPFGGFLLINSMAENGQQARQALLELSVRGGGPPINNINEADVALAERMQIWAIFVWLGFLVALVAALVVWLL